MNLTYTAADELDRRSTNKSLPRAQRVLAPATAEGRRLSGMYAEDLKDEVAASAKPKARKATPAKPATKAAPKPKAQPKAAEPKKRTPEQEARERAWAKVSHMPASAARRKLYDAALAEEGLVRVSRKG